MNNDLKTMFKKKTVFKKMFVLRKKRQNTKLVIEFDWLTNVNFKTESRLLLFLNHFYSYADLKMFSVTT